MVFNPRIILVPTDFSKYSDNAIAHAYDIAENRNAKIYLLHVIPKIDQWAITTSLSEQVINQLQSESIKEAKRKMDVEIKKILNTSTIEVVCDARVGTPFEEILKVQQEQKADLIVIASHGRTGIRNILIGSVAEKVIRNATCPVYLVRQ